MKHKPPFGFGSPITNNQSSQESKQGDEFADLFIKATGLLIDRVDILEKRVSALMDKLEQAEKKPEPANSVNLVDSGFNF